MVIRIRNAFYQVMKQSINLDQPSIMSHTALATRNCLTFPQLPVGTRDTKEKGTYNEQTKEIIYLHKQTPTLGQ